MSSPEHKPSLGVVIPVLNAAPGLPATLQALDEARVVFDLDVVLVDGGSTDETKTIAQAHGARVIGSPRGRGIQLAAGAGVVRGDWLLFLHADTVLEAGWAAALSGFMASAVADRCAVYFRFALDDDHPGARRIERGVAWRCRTLALPYGDQGLALASDLYNRLGGYSPLPLMEDVNFVRRIKRQQGRDALVGLDVAARTSAVRYRTGGYWRRPRRNLFCLMLYFWGVPVNTIARMYR